MRLAGLAHLYRRRVQAHPVSELLAMLGIATGVALVFAVQVANTSITGSVEQVAEGVTGSADLQLAARSPDGFDARVYQRVERLPGVRRAAPVLEFRVRVRGPGGVEAVSLAGADPRLADLGGSFLREFAAPSVVFLRGVALPAPMARRLGVAAADTVEVQIRGAAVRAPVATVLDSSEIGPLAESPIVPAPLPYVERISGLRGRLTRVLVAAAPGREEEVARRLRRIAAGRLDVGSSDTEARLLRQAGGTYSQSTALFAGLSALVGFLFAFNAMLVTAPQRRRFVAELRLNGYDDHAVLRLVIFEGLVLGIAASVVGLALGDQLSRHLFHSTPGYLSFAFAIGDQRVVTWGVVALAFATGIVAALLASARPLGDLFSSRPIDAPLRAAEGPEGRLLAHRSLIGATLALLLATTGVMVFAPEAALVGIILLAGAMLLAVPAVLKGALELLASLARRTRFPMFVLSIGELQSSLLRTCALAATAALAVFASVAIGGARHDLLRGLDAVDEAFAATADVWVTVDGDENSLTTAPFRPRPQQLAALRASDAVAGVRTYRGGFVDLLGRRVWVIARPPGDPAFVPVDEFVEGEPDRARRRLRAGGWAAVSEAIADRKHAVIGEPITVPTPSGSASFRVAAIVSNLGWAPGALIINANDYRSRWLTSDAAALEIDLRPDVMPAQGRQAVEQAMGPGSRLVIETAQERAARFKRLSRQGLDRLSQISTLVLIAAVLALAAAMGGVLWQRRPRLAGLKLSGFHDGPVWRALVLETGVVLAVGCTVGAVCGLYGQAVLARALERVTGFPVQYAPDIPLAVAVLLGIALVATAVTAFPGYLAARVPPRAGFEEG